MKKLALLLVLFFAVLLFLPFVNAAPTASDDWSFASETSASIYWRTSESVRAYVEYGLTTAYGSTTPIENDNVIYSQGFSSHRGYYSHMHQLENLQQTTTYHYRYVMVDDSGNTFYGSDRTFTTQNYSSRLDVESESSCQESGGATYQFCLNNAGATYVLTRDITVDQGGIWVQSDDITVDLNGHTLTYNNVADGTRRQRIGVYMSGARNVKVINGIIKQGLGNDGADSGANDNIGHNPIFGSTCNGQEFFGLKLEWTGVQVTGLMCNYGSDVTLHHNLINDLGTGVEDRESLMGAINLPNGLVNLHDNIITRTRQVCFSTTHYTTGNFYENEFYMDSWATNSECLSFKSGTKNYEAYNNKIFATGYYVDAIYPSASSTNGEIHDNFVEMWTGPFGYRFGEYSTQSTMVGFRVTWGPLHNVHVYDNHIVIHHTGVGKSRGMWISQTAEQMGLFFYNNTVELYSDGVPVGAYPPLWATVCTVVMSGLEGVISAPNVAQFAGIYNNTFISNVCHVNYKDDYYPPGKNTLLKDNVFRKIGNEAYYYTVRLGFTGSQTYDNILQDTKLEGGADLSNVRYDCNSGVNADYAVDWTLAVNAFDWQGNPAPVGQVTITDKYGAIAYQEFSEETSVYPVLREFWNNNCGSTITDYNPYTVTVSPFGNPVTDTVTVDYTKSIDLQLTTMVPLAQSMQCELNTPNNWQDCTSMQYGDTVLRVRTTCTQGDLPVARASFNITNVPDSNTLAYDQQSGSGTITWDNPNLLVRDSGNIKFIATCYDSANKYGSKTTHKFIPWGTFAVTSNPSDFIVSNGQEFFYSLTFSCQNGECGNIKATLDPELGLNATTGDILDDSYSRVDGSSSQIYGDNTYLVAGWLGSRQYYSWIKFNLSSKIPPGSTIANVSLRMYHYLDEDVSSHSGQTYSIYGSTTQDWDELDCYDHVNYPETCPVLDELLGSGITPQGADDGAYWQTFPLTNTGWLEEQTNASLDTITLGITRTSSGGTSYCRFYTKDFGVGDLAAHLEIDYFPPGYKGGTIPMNTGSPFYTTDQNPVNFNDFPCLQDMRDGDSCQVSWNVTTNTSQDGPFNFLTILESETYPDDVEVYNTPDVTVAIGVCSNPASIYDTNPCNGRIESSELLAAVSDWFADLITVPELMTNIKLWKNV